MIIFFLKLNSGYLLIWFVSQFIQPCQSSPYNVGPAAVFFVKNTELSASFLHHWGDMVQMAMIQAWEKMVLDLQIETIRNNMP